MKTVKASELIAEVKKLGEKFPDKKAGCTYFEADGKPCCIVGHALYKHGVTLNDLGKYNEMQNVDDLSKLGYIDRDVEEFDWEWLTEVQNRQDGGLPWAVAVDVPDEDEDL